VRFCLVFDFFFFVGFVVGRFVCGFCQGVFVFCLFGCVLFIFFGCCFFFFWGGFFVVSLVFGFFV